MCSVASYAITAPDVVFTGVEDHYVVRSQQPGDNGQPNENYYDVFVHGAFMHTHNCTCADREENGWRCQPGVQFGCKHIYAVRRHGLYEAV